MAGGGKHQAWDMHCWKLWAQKAAVSCSSGNAVPTFCLSEFVLPNLLASPGAKTHSIALSGVCMPVPNLWKHNSVGSCAIQSCLSKIHFLSTALLESRNADGRQKSSKWQVKKYRSPCLGFDSLLSVIQSSEKMQLKLAAQVFFLPFFPLSFLFFFFFFLPAS